MREVTSEIDDVISTHSLIVPRIDYRGKTPKQLLAPRLEETTGPDRKLKARVEEAISVGERECRSAKSWSVL